MSNETEEVERVYGVDRLKISKHLKQGFFRDAQLFETLNKEKYLMDRPDAEVDTSFKQIIPYAIISNPDGEILAYKRINNKSEARLNNKVSIGFGGHLNPCDKKGNEILDGLDRELSEEVNVNRKWPPVFLGFINNDSDEVGQCHIGVVFAVVLEDNEFEVLEKDKIEAYWSTTDELKNDDLEAWSKYLLDWIIESKNQPNVH